MIPVPRLFDMDNIYVAGLTEHQSLSETYEGLVDFGTPVAAANSTLLAATAIVTGQSLEVGIEVNAYFGRILNITSTDAGNALIVGRDYLNQPMSELVTCTAGTVATTKAFKWVDRIDSVAVDGNISIGPGTKLGLPFVAAEIIREYDDAGSATEGTLTAADTTDPATTTTDDTRGTYAPGTTMDGANRIQAVFKFNNLAAAGLYGPVQA